jgi:hypothetical protein
LRVDEEGMSVKVDEEGYVGGGGGGCGGQHERRSREES